MVPDIRFYVLPLASMKFLYQLWLWLVFVFVLFLVFTSITYESCKIKIELGLDRFGRELGHLFLCSLIWWLLRELDICLLFTAKIVSFCLLCKKYHLIKHAYYTGLLGLYSPWQVRRSTSKTEFEFWQLFSSLVFYTAFTGADRPKGNVSQPLRTFMVAPPPQPRYSYFGILSWLLPEML